MSEFPDQFGHIENDEERARDIPQNSQEDAQEYDEEPIVTGISYEEQSDPDAQPEQLEAFNNASLQAEGVIDQLSFTDQVLIDVDEFNPEKIMGKTDIKTFLQEQKGLLTELQYQSLQSQLHEQVLNTVQARWEREQQSAYERGLILHKPEINQAMEISTEDISNAALKDTNQFQEHFTQKGYAAIDDKYPEDHPFRKLLQEQVHQQIQALHERWKALNQAENQKLMLQRIQEIKERSRTLSFTKKEVERKADFWEKPELFSTFVRKDKMANEMQQLIALKDQLPKEQWEAAKREVKAHLESAPYDKWKAEYVKIEENRLIEHNREAEKALKVEAEDFKNDKYFNNPQAFEAMMLKKVGKLGLMKLEKHQRLRFQEKIKKKASLLYKDWQKGFEQHNKLKLLYAQDELKKTIAAIDPENLNEADLKTEAAFHKALENDPKLKKLKASWPAHHQVQLDKLRETTIAERYIKISKEKEKKAEEIQQSPEQHQQLLGEKLLGRLTQTSLPYRSLHLMQGKFFDPFFKAWSTTLGEVQFGLFLRDVQARDLDSKAFLAEAFRGSSRINAINKLRTEDPNSWKSFQQGLASRGIQLKDILSPEQEEEKSAAPEEEQEKSTQEELLEEEAEKEVEEEGEEIEEATDEQEENTEEDQETPESEEAQDENSEKEAVEPEQEEKLAKESSPKEDNNNEETAEEDDEIESEEPEEPEELEDRDLSHQERETEEINADEQESSVDLEENEEELTENDKQEAEKEDIDQELDKTEHNTHEEPHLEKQLFSSEQSEGSAFQELINTIQINEQSEEQDDTPDQESSTVQNIDDMMNFKEAEYLHPEGFQEDEEMTVDRSLDEDQLSHPEDDEVENDFPELSELTDITENLDKITELNALMDFINEDFQDMNWLLKNIQDELLQQLTQVDISEQKKQLLLERQQSKKNWWDQLGVQLDNQNDFDQFFDNFSGDIQVSQVIQLFVRYVNITHSQHIPHQSWCPKHLQNRIVEHPQEVFWSMVGHLEGLASPIPVSKIIIRIHQPAPRKQQERICFTLSLETAGEQSKRHHETDLKSEEVPRNIASEMLKNFQDYLSQSDETREAQITKLMDQLNQGATQEPFQKTRTELMKTMSQKKQ